jgi:hypothetical protein
MRAWFFGLGALSSIFWTSMVAQAQQTVDVAKITCDQFLAGRITDSRTLSVWLGGYFHGTRNDTLVDVSAFQKDSNVIMDYCFSHRNTTVMDAVKNAFGATTR